MDTSRPKPCARGETYEFGVDKPYWCDSCNVGFVFEIQLFEHVNAVHRRDALRSYRIPKLQHVPTPSCHSKSPLERDGRVRKPYIRRPKFLCTICRRSFLFASELSVHLRRAHHKIVNVCRRCGKGFRKRGRLLLHIREHREACPYVCYTCWKRFKTLHLLRLHAKEHSDLKGGFGIELYGTTLIRDHRSDSRKPKSSKRDTLCARNVDDENGEDRCGNEHTDVPTCVADIDLYEDDISLAVWEDLKEKDGEESDSRPETPVAVPDHVIDTTEDDEINAQSFRQVSVESMWNEDIPAMPFRCALCDHRFVTPEELTAHVPLHLCDDKYKCLVCKKPYKSAARLRQHVRSFHMTQKPYECTFCDKAFYSSYALKMHKKVHAWPQECEHCHRSYPNRARMKYHMKVHNAEVVHTCEFCGEMFLTKGASTRHVNVNHAELVRSTTPDKKRRKSGMPTEISIETQANVAKLSKTIGDETAITDASTAVSPQVCLLSLNTEIISESGQSVRKCALCEKTCSNVSAMKRHMKKHQCKYCKTAFRSPVDLTDHIKSQHANGKPYCQLCSTVFSTAGNLARHKMLKHLPDVTVECPKCKKLFATFNGLKKHCRIVHPNTDINLLLPKKVTTVKREDSDTAVLPEGCSASDTKSGRGAAVAERSPYDSDPEVDEIIELPDLDPRLMMDDDEMAIEEPSGENSSPEFAATGGDSSGKQRSCTIRKTQLSPVRKIRVADSIDKRNLVHIEEVNNNNKIKPVEYDEDCSSECTDSTSSRPGTACSGDEDSHESVTENDDYIIHEPMFLTPVKPALCIIKVEELTDNESDISEFEARKRTTSDSFHQPVNNRSENVGEVQSPSYDSRLSLRLSSDDDSTDDDSPIAGHSVSSRTDSRSGKGKRSRNVNDNIANKSSCRQSLHFSDDDVNADSPSRQTIGEMPRKSGQLNGTEIVHETTSPGSQYWMSPLLSSDDDDDAMICSSSKPSINRNQNKNINAVSKHTIQHPVVNIVNRSGTNKKKNPQSSRTGTADVRRVGAGVFSSSRACTKCKCRFASFSNMWRHYIIKHLAANPLTCSVCAGVLSKIRDTRHKDCQLCFVCLDCEMTLNETDSDHSVHCAGPTDIFRRTYNKLCSSKLHCEDPLSTKQAKFGMADTVTNTVNRVKQTESHVLESDEQRSEAPTTDRVIHEVKSKDSQQDLNVSLKKFRSLFDYFEDLSSESESEGLRGAQRRNSEQLQHDNAVDNSTSLTSKLVRVQDSEVAAKKLGEEVNSEERIESSSSIGNGFYSALSRRESMASSHESDTEVHASVPSVHEVVDYSMKIVRTEESRVTSVDGRVGETDLGVNNVTTSSAASEVQREPGTAQGSMCSGLPSERGFIEIDNSTRLVRIQDSHMVDTTNTAAKRSQKNHSSASGNKALPSAPSSQELLKSAGTKTTSTHMNRASTGSLSQASVNAETLTVDVAKTKPRRSYKRKNKTAQYSEHIPDDSGSARPPALPTYPWSPREVQWRGIPAMNQPVTPDFGYYRNIPPNSQWQNYWAHPIQTNYNLAYPRYTNVSNNVNTAYGPNVRKNCGDQNASGIARNVAPQSRTSQWNPVVPQNIRQPSVQFLNSPPMMRHSSAPGIAGKVPDLECSCFECVYSNQYARPTGMSAASSVNTTPMTGQTSTYYGNSASATAQRTYLSSLNSAVGAATVNAAPRRQTSSQTSVMLSANRNDIVTGSYTAVLDSMCNSYPTTAHAVTWNPPESSYAVVAQQKARECAQTGQTTCMPNVNTGTVDATVQPPTKRILADSRSNKSRGSERDGATSSDCEYVIVSKKPVARPISAQSNSRGNSGTRTATSCERSEQNDTGRSSRDDDVVLVKENGLIDSILNEINGRDNSSDCSSKSDGGNDQAIPARNVTNKDAFCCMFCRTSFLDELNLVKHVVEVHS